MPPGGQVEVLTGRYIQPHLCPSKSSVRCVVRELYSLTLLHFIFIFIFFKNIKIFVFISTIRYINHLFSYLKFFFSLYNCKFVLQKENINIILIEFFKFLFESLNFCAKLFNLP